MTIKARFIQFLITKYKSWNNPESLNLLNNLISDQLLSEKIIELPSKILTDIQNEITGYMQLREWGAEKLTDNYKAMGLLIPENNAVCTSFDFHVTNENQIKLIEINTNASFLAMGCELYDFYKINTGFNSNNIFEMFEQESLITSSYFKNLIIIDDDPTNQRLYVEFLLYQKILESKNVKVDIKDFSQINSPDDTLIYNRYTDFYLESEKSSHLKKLYNAQQIYLSPNPYEYFLLADKQRMIDWQNQSEIIKPNSLLKIYDLGLADREFIWSERKKLFFKPKNSYGGKQAYKGASISRRNFDEFYGPLMLAQEYIQPQEIDIDLFRNEIKSTEKMKFDLRCYAYKGKLQIVVARIYQGQTTNLRTDGGGFTVVNFV